MDSNTINAGLQDKQAWEGAQKNDNLAEMEKFEKKEKRFKRLGAGSFISVFCYFCLAAQTLSFTICFAVYSALNLIRTSLILYGICCQWLFVL